MTNTTSTLTEDITNKIALKNVTIDGESFF